VESADAARCLHYRLRPNSTNANCPKEVGPDFDFGNAPILRSLGGGRRSVIGQKSGLVYGLIRTRKASSVEVQGGQGQRARRHRVGFGG
jgi:hypothetical protein